VRVLATSREPLGVPGEVTWRIPSLTVPPATAEGVAEAPAFDAVRLFLERAEAAAPGFRSIDDTMPIVVSICRQLDGIPLAIELAAARLQALSVHDIAARLDDRFALLRSRSEVVMPRHRTLRAVVDFSYDLLSEEEQILFARLGVFAGEFTLGMVERVCAGGAIGAHDVLDLLARLVERSLVMRVDVTAGETRYRLLQTLRVYANERLGEEVEAPRYRRLHAEMVGEGARAVGPHPFSTGFAGWLGQMDRLHDDALAALDWLVTDGDEPAAFDLVVGLWPYWSGRYLLAEGRRWIERCLAINGGTTTARAAVVAAAADLAFWEDDFDAVMRLSEEGLTIAQTDDRQVRARLLLLQAQVARERDDPAAAGVLASQALALSEWADDAPGRSHAFNVLAMVAGDAGDLALAEARASECLDTAEAASFVEGRALGLGTLGAIAHARGELPRAAGLFEECLRHFQELENPWSAARARGRLGAIALAQGDARRAYDLGRESLAAHDELRSSEGIAEALLVMADASRIMGDLEQAELLASAALQRCRERGFSGQLMWGLTTAGSIALRRGELVAAASMLQEAVELFREGQTRHAASALLLFGLAHRRLGNPGTAKELCEQAVDVFAAAGDDRGVVRALVALADISLSTADDVAALRYLSAARATGRVAEVRGPDHEGPDYADLLREVRSRLGDGAFSRAWAAAGHDDAGQVIDVRDAAIEAPSEPAPQRGGRVNR